MRSFGDVCAENQQVLFLKMRRVIQKHLEEFESMCFEQLREFQARLTAGTLSNIIANKQYLKLIKNEINYRRKFSPHCHLTLGRDFDWLIIDAPCVVSNPNLSLTHNMRTVCRLFIDVARMLIASIDDHLTKCE